MGKSWFYLTLWRGSPPEFTEYVDAVLDTSDYCGTEIAATETTAQDIERMTSDNALIELNEPARADIIARTEVVWYVGRA